ncbi:MAG: hypothetical protein AABY32_01310 [Nanoarchaeota archaeon]
MFRTVFLEATFNVNLTVEVDEGVDMDEVMDSIHAEFSSDMPFEKCEVTNQNLNVIDYAVVDSK